MKYIHFFTGCFCFSFCREAWTLLKSNFLREKNPEKFNHLNKVQKARADPVFPFQFYSSKTTGNTCSPPVQPYPCGFYSLWFIFFITWYGNLLAPLQPSHIKFPEEAPKHIQQPWKEKTAQWNLGKMQEKKKEKKWFKNENQTPAVSSAASTALCLF